MQFEELTDEQKTKLKNCKTAKDILALAREEGHGLSEEDLESVSGGWFDGVNCMRDMDF